MFSLYVDYLCMYELNIWSLEWLHGWPASLPLGPTLFSGVEILAVQQESIRFHSRNSKDNCGLKVCHDLNMLKIVEATWSHYILSFVKRSSPGSSRTLKLWHAFVFSAKNLAKEWWFWAENWTFGRLVILPANAFVVLNLSTGSLHKEHLRSFEVA